MFTLRKLFVYIFLFVVTFTTKAEVGIGLKDSRYAYVSYLYKEKYLFKLEQSIYPEKIGFQYFRLNAGYRIKSKYLTFNSMPYYGMAYNACYFNCGISFDIESQILKWMNLYCNLNPHYDTGYNYNTCYKFGLRFRIHKDISIITSYTNIPEYRKTEKRLRAGLLFSKSNLKVKPILSIPISDNIKSMRILVSMDYIF